MTARRDLAIWAFAFGYFACYAPYSALTKLASRTVDGFELLPLTTLSSLVAMITFLVATGWWRHASLRRVLGRALPVPGPWTALSGVATAAIIATTTLAYTFGGVSIVFMMLLMRGGVLVLAPIVDALTRRKVQWWSWIALALSMAALVVAIIGKSRAELTVVAAIDVAVYLASYFVRLRFMSRLAKSPDRSSSIRYFVEEQMVATPAIVLVLALFALVGHGETMLALRRGFVSIWTSDALAPGIVIGLFSQGTGVFGALILLDGRENAFCVPVNRGSSVLAGVVASFALGSGVAASELAGAALVLAAIAVLSMPSFATLYARCSQEKGGARWPVQPTTYASRSS